MAVVAGAVWEDCACHTLLMVFMERILSLENPFVPLLLFIMQWGFAGLWGACVAEEDHYCVYV